VPTAPATLPSTSPPFHPWWVGNAGEELTRCLKNSDDGQHDATWTPPIGPIDLPPLDAGLRIFSLFEFWPPAIFYLPAALQWAWLALRYGSVTLPTLANPLMEAGGLCGESKSLIFAQLGAEARRWLAPFVTVTASLQNELLAIEDKIDAEGIG
jgi:hypothetical protein